MVENRLEAVAEVEANGSRAEFVTPIVDEHATGATGAFETEVRQGRHGERSGRFLTSARA